VLTAEQLKKAVAEVLDNPAYLQNIRKVADPFEQAGGYPKAVAEIFKLKKGKGI
jgi:UDP:flavonoid glycosyltransferase YjiC (YdhE family)